MSCEFPALILLSAGGGRRMGGPKGLIAVDGTPLVRAHLDAFASVSSERTVVLGADAAAHLCHVPPGVRVVFNPDWSRSWPADSLQLALRGRPIPLRAWVCPVDVPPPSPAVLRALLQGPGDRVPTDPDGRPGHPVLVTHNVLQKCQVAPPHGGLRTLIGTAQRVPTAAPVALNFNSAASLESFVRARRAGE